MPPPVDLRRLLALARPHLRRLILATVFMLLGSGIGLVTPMVAGKVVDAALLEGSIERLNRVVLALVGLFGALGVTAFAEHYLLRATGARLLLELRDRLFAHLLLLAPDFYQRRPVGELISRMGSDLTLVQGAITRQIPNGIQATLRFLGTLVILLVLQTRLTLVALLVIPPVALIAVGFGKRIERLSTQERDRTAHTAAVAEESLGGIRTVQAFTRSDHEHRRYRSGLQSLLEVQLRNARIEASFAGLIQFAAFSAFALVLWYGGRLMLQGELSPGELTSFLLYTFSIAVSVGTLGALYAAYRELRGASARIFQLLDTAPTIADTATPIRLERCRGEIRFEHVDFRYGHDEGRWAIRDLDLKIESGEIVGLVGPSGAGKTTIFSLLLRFADPRRGRVEVDGHDLRALALADLRRHIGIVPQEIFLFSGSIAENIAYGRPGATDEQIRRAACLAGANAFILELPAGYDETVDQRGQRLSAGQRQRIAIARAFLRDPAILLLDEATSALDPESEEKVQQALAQLLHGRTTLVIAHRLATAQRAHRILVLERGRIAGVGSHEELFADNALYRRYWELQSLRRDPGQA